MNKLHEETTEPKRIKGDEDNHLHVHHTKNHRTAMDAEQL
jgi:hypothetical protein